MRAAPFGFVVIVGHGHSSFLHVKIGKGSRTARKQPPPGDLASASKKNPGVLFPAKLAIRGKGSNRRPAPLRAQQSAGVAK